MRVTYIGVTILIAALSVVVIVVLLVQADHHINYKYASFDRSLKDEQYLQIVYRLDLAGSRKYIAGFSPGEIYLGDFDNPFKVVEINIQTRSVKTLLIATDSDSIAFQNILLRIDYPYFFLVDGNIPFVYRGTVGAWKAFRVMTEPTYFVDAIPISKSVLAMRSMVGGKFALVKRDLAADTREVFNNLLEKQVDGLLCTTGMLHYSAESKRIVYLYQYRNEYLCMDTSFHLVAKGHTVDTIRYAKIQTTRIHSENSVTMTAPPLVVNRLSALDDTLLYVNSNILARNQKPEEFEASSTIDVYSINNNRYRLSFYIPTHNERKMVDFKVLDSTTIAVLYGDSFALYYHPVR